MNKTKLKYVKFTPKELNGYVRDKSSCIHLVNSEMHIGFPPWGFASFQETLTNLIAREKIGKYDAKLDGIILDVRKIKVFGTNYTVHDDDPINHLNIKANFYVFRPRIGALIRGVVKHISQGHVAVIIYRVFNVSIRFDKRQRQPLKINDTISFRIKSFDLQDAMPYIAGELIDDGSSAAAKNAENKHKKFDENDDATNGGDSGISTEETSDGKTQTKGKKLVKKESSSDDSVSESGSSSESSSDEETDKKKPILLPNVSSLNSFRSVFEHDNTFFFLFFSSGQSETREILRFRRRRSNQEIAKWEETG